MARPASRHPTELELEILKVLWREGPLSGRQVRDALVPFRDLAYTSVMTVMNIMAGRPGALTPTTRGSVSRPSAGRCSRTWWTACSTAPPGR